MHLPASHEPDSAPIEQAVPFAAFLLVHDVPLNESIEHALPSSQVSSGNLSPSAPPGDRTDLVCVRGEGAVIATADLPMQRAARTGRPVLGETIETDVDGFSASLVGFVPIGPVDAFARIGAIDWSADVQSSGLNLRDSDDGTDLTYGIGAQFRVWSLGIRAEYEVFDLGDADNVDLISLGVTWTFL